MSKQKNYISTKASSRRNKGLAAHHTSKISQLETMLRRPQGASLSQLVKVLNWRAHSVRGVMSGSLKKKRGLKITATKAEGQDRIYRIAE